MSFWEKIQEDIRQNIKEGLDIFKEGSSVVTEKIEQLTEGGKKKYKVFNLNMKVQEEFTKLGGEVYDLITKKSKNPLGNRKVTAVIKRINKLETQITKLDEKETVKTRKKTAAKKTTSKKSAKKKTAPKRSASLKKSDKQS